MMRLNVGAGEERLDGFLSIDIRDDCGADVVCDVGDLPFDDGSVTEIVAFDILEHVPNTRTHELLNEWHRVLEPGGTLTVRCPNLHVLAVQLAYWQDKPGPQLTALLDNLHGGHKFGPDGAWDTHHWSFSPKTLAEALFTAGFDVLSNDEAINQTVTAVAR